MAVETIEWDLATDIDRDKNVAIILLAPKTKAFEDEFKGHICGHSEGVSGDPSVDHVPP
jgi:hypothetical protein